MGAVIFFYRLGAPGLMDPDEGRYAEIAREMLVLKDWLVPHLNLFPYLEKPPLVYWFTALSFKALGYNELAARLPSAVSALGGLFLAYALGRVMWGPAAAFLGATVLATCSGYVALGRLLTLDMTLAFWVNLGIGLGYLALRQQQPRLWPWAYAALALAVLTKGPVALILAGLVWGLWVLIQRRTWKSLISLVQPWSWLLLAVLVLPWFAYSAVAPALVFPLFYPGAKLRPLSDPGHPPAAHLLFRAGAAGIAAALDLPAALGLMGAKAGAGPGSGLFNDLGRRGAGLLLTIPGEAGPLYFAGLVAPGLAAGKAPGGFQRFPEGPDH